jgi:uncharacterized membrane-anchored protein YitT (DUF2179 family)
MHSYKTENVKQPNLMKISTLEKYIFKMRPIYFCFHIINVPFIFCSMKLVEKMLKNSCYVIATPTSLDKSEL